MGRSFLCCKEVSNLIYITSTFRHCELNSRMLERPPIHRLVDQNHRSVRKERFQRHGKILILRVQILIGGVLGAC